MLGGCLTASDWRLFLGHLSAKQNKALMHTISYRIFETTKKSFCYWLGQDLKAGLVHQEAKIHERWESRLKLYLEAYVQISARRDVHQLFGFIFLASFIICHASNQIYMTQSINTYWQQWVNLRGCIIVASNVTKVCQMLPWWTRKWYTLLAKIVPKIALFEHVLVSPLQAIDGNTLDSCNVPPDLSSSMEVKWQRRQFRWGVILVG